MTLVHAEELAGAPLAAVAEPSASPTLGDRFRAHARALGGGGRSPLYAVLLWLADGSERHFRLLEIGASAGLNLRADRYAHHVGEATLGDPSSAVRFEEPWQPGPRIDLAAAQDRPGPGQILSPCGDHGPPVVWKPPAPTAG